MLIPLAVGIVILAGLVFAEQAFNLKLRPDSAQQTLLLVTLSVIVFLLLVALSFVLMRNLLKLYAERRMGVLGSRFRTRMVVGSLLLSFAPVLTMFMFSYALMNRSIDKWFSGPVYQVQQDADRIVQLLSDYAGYNARQEAIEIAREDDVRRALATGDRATLLNELRSHDPTLQGGFAVALAKGNQAAAYNLPQRWEALRPHLPPLVHFNQAPQKLQT